MDLCPECPQGNLDFSPQAFDKIAERVAGRVSITWKFVPCDVSGPISYKYKDGANQRWTAVQVRNHRIPVAKLEWSSDDAIWNPMVRQDYNYFLNENGFGSSPVRVRVTAIDGQVLEDELPTVQELNPPLKTNGELLQTESSRGDSKCRYSRDRSATRILTASPRCSPAISK